MHQPSYLFVLKKKMLTYLHQYQVKYILSQGAFMKLRHYILIKEAVH